MRGLCAKVAVPARDPRQPEPARLGVYRDGARASENIDTPKNRAVLIGVRICGDRDTAVPNQARGVGGRGLIYLERPAGAGAGGLRINGQRRQVVLIVRRFVLADDVARGGAGAAGVKANGLPTGCAIAQTGNRDAAQLRLDAVTRDTPDRTVAI